MPLKQSNPGNPHDQQRSGGYTPGAHRPRQSAPPTNMLPGQENAAKRGAASALGNRTEASIMRNDNDNNKPIG